MRPIRFLLTKPGTDTHWRGVAVLTWGLREAGIEVISTGNIIPEQIPPIAIQEDVAMVGISVGCESFIRYVPEIMRLLKEHGYDKPVILGGHVPKTYIPWLTEIGIDKVFLPETSPLEVAAYIKQRCQ